MRVFHKIQAIFDLQLYDKILNVDFNNEGLPDTTVIIEIAYSGIGYFINTV